MSRDITKKEKKKKPMSLAVKGAIGFGVFIVIYVVYLGFQPLRGTISFGICKVFIEQQTTYPDEIRYVSAYEKPNDVRIDYMTINEFGEYETKSTACIFQQDQTGALFLADVVTNRQKIAPEKIQKFNLGIPAILAYPPDLVTPGILPDDLMKLWRGY